MYREKWKNYFFASKYLHLPPKWTIVRNAADSYLSKEAQLRLEWMIFYLTVARKNARLTAEHFGISRKTFHKWLSRFDEGNLKSLESQSKAPKNKRSWTVTAEQEEKVKLLRKEHLELGKKKLQSLYFQEHGQTISTWKIERVIKKHQLYPDLEKHRKQVERRRTARSKIRIHQIQEQIKQTHEYGLLWHIDAIIIWWYGQKRVIFTALEDTTRIAFARVYATNTSGYAEDFLQRLLYLADGKVRIMHADNGSEFQGAFERACGKMQILQVYSRPYTPKDNAALERFNRTIQEEWLDLSEAGMDDIQLANDDLTFWLIKYNYKRPHQALDYQTPFAYALKEFPELLPMSPASTPG